MAQVRVRSLTDTILEYDMVVLDSNGTNVRYPFKFSPKGTADADVVITEISDNLSSEFSAKVVAKTGTVRPNNPKWDDVKTDTDGDGANDTGGYGWEQSGALYEII